MSVHLTLTCGGCDAPAVTVGPLRKRFHGTHGDWGFGAPRVDPVEDLTPEGWVMFDPWTYCTYCPECWASINDTSSPLASSSPASSGSTVGMEPVVRGLPSPPGSRTTDGFDAKETR